LLIDLIEITENILKSKTVEKDVISVLLDGKVILQFSLAEEEGTMTKVR
jgi:hypothetical protein